MDARIKSSDRSSPFVSFRDPPAASSCSSTPKRTLSACISCAQRTSRTVSRKIASATSITSAITPKYPV